MSKDDFVNLILQCSVTHGKKRPTAAKYKMLIKPVVSKLQKQFGCKVIPKIITFDNFPVNKDVNSIVEIYMMFKHVPEFQSYGRQIAAYSRLMAEMLKSKLNVSRKHWLVQITDFDDYQDVKDFHNM